MGLLLLFTRPEVMGAWAARVARDGAEEKFWKGIPSLSGLVIPYSPCRPQLDLDLSGKPCLTSEVQPPSQGGRRKVHPGAFRKTRWSRLWHWDERGTPGPFWGLTWTPCLCPIFHPLSPRERPMSLACAHAASRRGPWCSWGGRSALDRPGGWLLLGQLGCWLQDTSIKGCTRPCERDAGDGGQIWAESSNKPGSKDA